MPPPSCKVQVIGVQMPPGCADDQAIAAALQAEEEQRAVHAAGSYHHQDSVYTTAWNAQDIEGGGYARDPSLLDTTTVGDSISPWRKWLRCFAIVLILVSFGVVIGIVVANTIMAGYSTGALAGHDLGEFVEVSRAAFDATNRYRATKGLAALEWSDGIAAVAARHAEGMASGQQSFSHVGFRSRAAQFPMAYASAGENLARCPPSDDLAGCAANGWINSPEHEENLVGSWTWCGIGTARSANDGNFYFTQLFAAAL